MSDASAFLKLSEPISGGSADRGHPGWIEILSVGGFVASAGAAKREDARLHELTLTKRVDVGSATLMRATAEGRIFAWAILDIPGSRMFLTMQNVAFVDVQRGSGESEPLELVRIAFDGAELQQGRAPDRILTIGEFAAGAADLAISRLRQLLRTK